MSENLRGGFFLTHTVVVLDCACDPFTCLCTCKRNRAWLV